MSYDLWANPLGGLASDIDIAVAIAADDRTRRRISSAVLREGMRVAAQADDPQSLPTSCLRQPPHVAVVAWSACAPAPSAALRRLRRQLSRTRVVVIMGESRREDVRAAVDAGADAVVLESRLAVTLGVTVRAVCAGQACLPRELRRQFERPALSSRERQILGMVATGCTNAQIAERLFLAESTVKGHLASAFSKLGIHSRQEAAALVSDPESRLGIGLLAVTDQPQPTAENGVSR
jgi:DNA-binding NarL/FixJ family response regulator